jgi:hypothetical protein
VLLPLVGALPTLDAQQAPPVTLTLADAVRLASTTAPAGQAAAGRRAETVGRARAEAQWANPTLELRRENQGAPIPYDDFATVTLPFDLTGRRFALRSALGASRDRARADSVHAMRTAEFAVARAWWESWASRTIARIAVEQSALYDRVARIDSLPPKARSRGAALPHADRGSVPGTPPDSDRRRRAHARFAGGARRAGRSGPDRGGRRAARTRGRAGRRGRADRRRT